MLRISAPSSGSQRNPANNKPAFSGLGNNIKTMKTQQNNQTSLIEPFYFPQRHLWRQKQMWHFVFTIHNLFQKLSCFPCHHHINIMYTQYHLQLLKARGLVHSLVLQRLDSHLIIIIHENKDSLTAPNTFVRPRLLQRLHSLMWTGNYKKKGDDSQKAVVCHLCGMIKNRKLPRYVYTHTRHHCTSDYNLQ